MAVPVFADGRWWGHIGFDDCRDERDWAPTEIDTLKTLAELIGATVSDHRHEAILEAVATSAKELLRSSDLRQSLPGVLELVGQATGVDRAHIFLIDADDGDGRILKQSGASPTMPTTRPSYAPPLGSRMRSASRCWRRAWRRRPSVSSCWRPVATWRKVTISASRRRLKLRPNCCAGNRNWRRCEDTRRCLPLAGGSHE
jgi:GAF domain-containing protein